VAQAHEFKPSWGYANIDDRPFQDPSGALLPTTQVWPRGVIRDVRPPDDHDVRMTVRVYITGMDAPFTSNAFDEGDFVDKSIEQKLELAPNQVAFLRYEFCRFIPPSGAVKDCLVHSISRPVPTTPTVEPTPVGQPAPADVDGDGYAAGVDCEDRNVTVHPGAKEIAGNGLDDDCAGGDAPAVIYAGVKNKWVKSGRRMRVERLQVVDAPQGARVEVRCRGRRCPFKLRTTVAGAKGTASLRRFFKRGVRPKITIDVVVNYPNMVGRLFRFRVAKLDVPNSVRYCLPPGGAGPQRC